MGGVDEHLVADAGEKCGRGEGNQRLVVAHGLAQPLGHLARRFLHVEHEAPAERDLGVLVRGDLQPPWNAGLGGPTIPAGRLVERLVDRTLDARRPLPFASK